VERLDLTFGGLSLGKLGVRLRPKPLGLEQERALTEQPAPARDAGLSGWVPSPLITTDRRMFALAVGGAPAWSRRLRRIDELTDAALAELEAAWRALAWSQRRRPGEFADRWRTRAAQQDFSRVNELIRRHNEYYPAEANLPMSVHTGDFIGIGGREWRRALLDAAWVLRRFPAELAAALA
jgi:hypothetical protein